MHGARPRGNAWALRAVRAVRRGRGFTMVELMITLAVAVMLIAIAVPSFNSIILTNKLTTAANDVVGALTTARMEAVKRNANAQFCSNSAASNTSDTLGTQCGTLAGAVYVMTSGTTTAQVHAGTVGITAPVQLSGNMTALRFNGQGLGYTIGASTPYGGAVADICTSSLNLTNNHRVITMTAGSIITVTTSSGACP
ncbi:GspH/FimT family pseudopilin [Dyella soli]|uniref:GspH/FimT family pseudopilin n=1 Tax=Dyella soli TaxID=522319 RepID=UPI003CCCAE3A